MSKLKNIEAVRKMLDGTHAFQTKKTFSFNEKNIKQKHNVGERWYELDSEGKPKFIWEQKEGHRFKLPLSHYTLNPDEDLNLEDDYSKCRHSECKTKRKTKLDKRFSRLRQMCAQCNFEVEDLLKAQGKFKEYEKEILKNNAKSILRDLDQKVEEVSKYLENGYEEVIDADGRIKKIPGNKEAAAQFRKDVQEYKNFVMDNI